MEIVPAAASSRSASGRADSDTATTRTSGKRVGNFTRDRRVMTLGVAAIGEQATRDGWVRQPEITGISFPNENFPVGTPLRHVRWCERDARFRGRFGGRPYQSPG